MEDQENTTSVNSTSVCCSTCHKVINDDQEQSVLCAKCKNWNHVHCTMDKEVFDILAKVDNNKKKKLVLVGILAYICESCVPSLDSKEAEVMHSKEILVPTQAAETQTSFSSVVDIATTFENKQYSIRLMMLFLMIFAEPKLP